jgi:hypothetical protein
VRRFAAEVRARQEVRLVEVMVPQRHPLVTHPGAGHQERPLMPDPTVRDLLLAKVDELTASMASGSRRCGR